MIAIVTPINKAYGRPHIDIHTTNNSPNIQASKHCPDKKLENVASIISTPFKNRCTLSFLNIAYNTFVICFPSFSFCIRI